jgi:hypothetical protein
MTLALLWALLFAAVRSTRQMLSTNVGSELFVTLVRVRLLHFIQ